MLAVIFRAKIKNLDAEYSAMAQRMRELALNQYGCIEFIACSEGEEEIAISYWETAEQIKLWKQDAEHLNAQQLGQNKWYASYTVQVVEVQREYRVDLNSN